MLDSMLWQFLPLFLLLGSVAGVLAGLLGVGGGLVIVPALLWAFTGMGFPADLVAHLAVGTSLASIVATSVSSLRAHHRRGAVRWPLVRLLSPGLVAGTVLGAVLAGTLPTLWLQRSFGAFAVLVGLRMAVDARRSARHRLPGPLGLSLAGGVIGAVSGIVGIGGGSMTVPFLHACRVAMREAVATSAACGLPIALVGSLGFAWTGWGEPGLPAGSIGHLYVPALLGVAVASVFTAPVGAALAHRLPVAMLRRAFAVLLVVIGLRLLFPV